jgi:hypothetical protein
MSQAHDIRALLTQLHEEAKPEGLATKTFTETWNFYRGREDPALTESKQKVQTLEAEVESLTTEVESLKVDNTHLESTIDKLVENASFKNYIIGFRYITIFFRRLGVLDLQVDTYDTFLRYFGLSRVKNEVKAGYKLSGFLLQDFQKKKYEGSCDKFTTSLRLNEKEILQEAGKLNLINLFEPINSYSKLFNIS